MNEENLKQQKSKVIKKEQFMMKKEIEIIHNAKNVLNIDFQDGNRVFSEM